ncbi:uncharacterized protein [Watersipora subatra]|uniref:uncharacterized protein n=1 Tax=Watersipora subatra TaxID=2589382 RepID=UPI00355B51D8
MATGTDTTLADGAAYLNATTYATIAEGAVSDSLGTSQTDAELREQDRFLPIANVARIMKKAIPSSGKISKEAKECCQECVSEFISFITSEASDRCAQEKRKTINGEDILYAMSTLGFDSYVEPLKTYLHKYRDSAKDRVGTASEDPMFSDGSTIIATLGEGAHGQSVYYPTQYMSTGGLDTD